MTFTSEQLGDSVTLYLGDCLEVLRTLAPNSVDAVVTSPPYNVGKEYEQQNDTLDYEFLLRGFIRYAQRPLDRGGYLIINTNDRFMSTEVRSGISPVLPMIDAECVLMSYILYDRRIWTKDPAWMRDRWHACSCRSIDEFEHLLIYRKPGASRRVLSITARIAAARDRLQMSNSDIDAAMGTNGMAGHWTSQTSQPEAPSIERWPQLRALLRVDNAQLDRDIANANVRIRTRLESQEWTDWGSRGVWHIRSVRANDIHPAMFPIELPTRLVRLFTDAETTILDPFMGSGTTGVACVQLGRKFIGIEICEDYYEIAKRRISDALLQGSLL